MGNTEAAPHKSAVAKNFFQPFRFGISGNVIVVDFPSKEKIAHSTATKVGEMSGAMEAIEDLENLLAHLRSGDRVLVAVDNSWFH